jgi:hypothetical protein
MKPTARLHKILAKDESYQIGGLRLLSGDFTASDQEHIETYFPGCHLIMENTARAIPVRKLTEEDWLVASEAVAIEGFLQGCGGRWYLRLKNGI